MTIVNDISVFFCTFALRMNKICLIIFVLLCFGSHYSIADSFQIEDVLEDIYNQLSEDDEILQEDLQEQLMNILAHPINLNSTNADELSKLLFLSDEQIDAILVYQYQHPFQDIYELQLIDCLNDYDIRNLIPFVYIGNINEKKSIYFREIFHYAKHEITLRADARNIEDFDNDPMYAKLRYRFNYQNRVQAGLTLDRTASAAWQNVNYGGYIQMQDMGPMKNIVMGNYQASYGYGLVVGSPFKRGKIAYIQSTSATDEGIKKFGSVGNSYDYFHGVGTTIKLGNWTDVSAFYSIREEKDNQWHHVVGANVTGKWKKVKVGITAIENIYYANTQAVIGINARWNIGKVDLWGEVAISQGNKWGIGSISGIRYTPLSDFNLLAIHRYYSPEYNNQYANALCSWTRIKDEHGGYLGIEYNRLNNWQLSSFIDIWKNGFETIVQADFIPKKDYRMHSRFRVKRKDNTDTYSIRWNMAYNFGMWNFKTQLDGNLVQSGNIFTYGWSAFQDVEYKFVQIPIVLQLRAQIFDAQKWDNRVYIYENDVLYAYSIPFVYGLGGRFFLNARYKINDTFSVYLRVSETIYQDAWAIEHDKKSTRTDVHALLRVKL